MAADVRKPLKNFVAHLFAPRDQNLNQAEMLVRYPSACERSRVYGLREITRELRGIDGRVE